MSKETKRIARNVENTVAMLKMNAHITQQHNVFYKCHFLHKIYSSLRNYAKVNVVLLRNVSDLALFVIFGNFYVQLYVLCTKHIKTQHSFYKKLKEQQEILYTCMQMILAMQSWFCGSIVKCVSVLALIFLWTNFMGLFVMFGHFYI